MRTRYILFFLIGLASLVLFASCEKDWLDAKADEQQAILATLKDFQAILNHEIYVNRESISTLAELASDGHFTTDAAFLASTNDMSINAYTWSNDRQYDNFNWTSGFTRVYYSNVVLDAIQAYEPVGSEELELNNIRGQALFHRADAFFRLAQVWSPPYTSATENKPLGIPLRLEADVTIPSIRSTIGQTYKQVIIDLTDASILLSPDYFVKTRPYKLSAFALLARVYLAMGDYIRAGIFADSCLMANSELMDYNDLPTSGNFIGDVNNNPEIIFYVDFSTTNFLTTACFIDPELYSLYDDNDLRKAVFFRTNADSTVSFKGNYGRSASRLFSGLSNDELFLIRAESRARQGEVDLAMKDLNALLRTRWRKVNGESTYVDQSAADASAALKIILTERRKELLLRGLRWADLRRLNLEEAFKKTLSRTIDGKTYTLEPGSFRYTFPIPDEILSKSGMQQNPGW